MATKNAINNKSGSLTVDPGASGDSFVQFNINTTGEFRIGVDDDASDAFKISQGSALGSNDTFIMTANGERTMPLQCAFQAYRATNADNVTGDATQYTIVFTNEDFDQNGDFDGTSTFTAPVTGYYHFNLNVRYNDLTASHTNSSIQFVTTAQTYICWTRDVAATRNTGDDNSATASIFVPMTAADTCTVIARVIGGTKVVDVIGGNRDTAFSGFLVC